MSIKLFAVISAALVVGSSANAQSVPRPTRDLEIKHGMPYAQARPVLIESGWQPSLFKKTILDDRQRDLQGWFIDHQFVEVESCAGTGDGLCIVRFHDAAGHNLFVFTTSGEKGEIKYIGHEPQIVSFCLNRKSVNCEAPLKSTEPVEEQGEAMSGTKTSKACTKARAAELAQSAHPNDPCLVHWRSIEVVAHPEKALELECAGIKAFEDPQPPGHPISLGDCNRITADDQRRMGLPPIGLSASQIERYRTTWTQH